MPARVDNLGVGKDQKNHSQLEIVGGVLVDEERPPKLSVDTRVFEVLLAQGLKRRRIQLRENVRVGRSRGRRVDVLKPLYDSPNMSELPRRLDRGMTAEDLFDQCRSRPQPPQNEDRIF